MKGKILIADDETRIRILVSDFLEAEGYDVITAKDGQEALDLFYAHKDCKLIILDVMMPFYDGFQVVEEIRPLTDTPILMLTAKSTDQDELTGFKLGVDDYVRKPFSPTILVARVNALFSRVYGDYETLEKGIIHFLLKQKKITIENQDIELSHTEFQLLYYLAENEGIVLSRDQILYKVWGFNYEGTERTVDTHMNRLRNKLGKAMEYIQTVRGMGYRFEVTKL
ncbi:response regulator transcription factor [Fusibacter bizertensis]